MSTQNDPLRIHLSLVSHTNIGKTTLARTLLSRDVGEVEDRAHVTQEATSYVLARNSEGCELLLWDTPGFGNSLALARRLEGRSNPIGWFIAEIWDRMANKSFWLDQQAMKHIRETSSVVLYLVNAAEPPETASYVEAEMRILTWIGKPVIVLLNQMGQPRRPEEEAADVEQWQKAMEGHSIVSEVLSLDAFAR
ncbi:MAG: GTPase domain-containing protein, partial [Succinivibrionaceae bacterium]|nr:GTPase domain-containing protein [Succinivibrionaceae bacterium]